MAQTETGISFHYTLCYLTIKPRRGAIISTGCSPVLQSCKAHENPKAPKGRNIFNHILTVDNFFKLNHFSGLPFIIKWN